VPSTTLLEIPPAEQVQMRAVLRRTRYGYLLAFHILLLCAAGRTPTEIAAFLLCSRSSVYRIRAGVSRRASWHPGRPRRAAFYRCAEDHLDALAHTLPRRLSEN
jgi:hypothetical protein